MLQYVSELLLGLSDKKKAVTVAILVFAISLVTWVTYYNLPSSTVYPESERIELAVDLDNTKVKIIEKGGLELNDGKLIYRKVEFDDSKKEVESQHKTEADRFKALD